jgi:hypothetical protein
MRLKGTSVEDSLEDDFLVLRGLVVANDVVDIVEKDGVDVDADVAEGVMVVDAVGDNFLESVVDVPAGCCGCGCSADEGDDIAEVEECGTFRVSIAAAADTFGTGGGAGDTDFLLAVTEGVAVVGMFSFISIQKYGTVVTNALKRRREEICLVQLLCPLV